MARFSTTKRNQLITSFSSSQARSTSRSNWTHLRPTKVKSESSFAQPLMVLMSLSQLVPIELSSYGNRRIRKAISVSRRSSGMSARCLIWCISTKSSFSSLRAQMARCAFGESTRLGSYCCILGLSFSRQYRSFPQRGRANSRMSGWHVSTVSRANRFRFSRVTLKAQCTFSRLLKPGEKKRTASLDCSWSKIWSTGLVSFRCFWSSKRISSSRSVTTRLWSGLKLRNEREPLITNWAIRTKLCSRACAGTSRSRNCTLQMKKATSMWSMCTKRINFSVSNWSRRG